MFDWWSLGLQIVFILDMRGGVKMLMKRVLIFETEMEQAHLKMACETAVTKYRNRKKYCEKDDPLTNILIFTDGGHTPGLDWEYPWPGDFINKRLNKYGEFCCNDWIKPIATLENVLLGVIDYSGDLLQFPEEGMKFSGKNSSKVTCCSILSKEILQKAYDRDERNPPPPDQSLLEVFGPIQNLEGRRFIVSSKVIRDRPQVTSAFVRLGTASSFGRTAEVDEDTYNRPNRL